MISIYLSVTIREHPNTGRIDLELHRMARGSAGLGSMVRVGSAVAEVQRRSTLVGI